MSRRKSQTLSDAGPCRLVLVVDDDADARDVIERLLDRHKIPCLVVGSAALALRVMQTREVAVLLTDFQMPDIDGLDLVRAVKATYPRTRPILLTGHEGGLSVEEQAEVHGNVLLKPVDSYTLASKVLHELEVYRLAAGRPKTNGSNGHG